jgi:hypothetical protein
MCSKTLKNQHVKDVNIEIRILQVGILEVSNALWYTHF